MSRCRRLELDGAFEVSDRVPEPRLVQRDPTQVLMKARVIRMRADGGLDFPLRVGVAVRVERSDTVAAVLRIRSPRQNDDARQDQPHRSHYSSSTIPEESNASLGPAPLQRLGRNSPVCPRSGLPLAGTGAAAARDGRLDARLIRATPERMIAAATIIRVPNSSPAMSHPRN